MFITVSRKCFVIHTHLIRKSKKGHHLPPQTSKVIISSNLLNHSSMTSFFEKTFAVIADNPEAICAVLATSREIMNCSAVPVTLSTDETWDSLCSFKLSDENYIALPKNERKFLQLFSTFSDTMQFTEKLRIQNRQDEAFVKGILENLIKRKRYFSRTIRVLQLPSTDALIEVCCSHSSSTSTTTPNCQILSNLRSLSIERCGDLQNQQQLKSICSLCPFLENMNIPRQHQLTDEGVASLSTNLKHLKTLEIANCKEITDSGFEHLAKLPTLQSLNLESCGKITDSGLQQLAKLSSLQTLNLIHCNKITDSGLEHLAKLPTLQTLNLTRSYQITDTSLQHLANLSSLQSLNLCDCNNITDSGLQHLADVLSLQTLDFSWCTKITDAGLQHLGKLSSLQSLNLFRCSKITDSGLQHLADLSSLQSLNLGYCEKITDSGLEHLAKLSFLHSLNLESCKLITHTGLQHLASLSALRSLNLP